MAPEKKWAIVLIDDEEDIREVLTLTLEDAGYRTWSAKDGRAGLALCEAIRPQIVITDIRMPKLTGLEVLEALKQSQPDTEVIVATAYGEMDLAIRALQLDASDFITKPINDETLHLALKRAKSRYLARKERRDYAEVLKTESAETAQELLRTVTFRNNLIEHSMDGILACDDTGKVVVYNQSMEMLLGLRKDEVLGKLSLKDLFSANELERFSRELAANGFGGKNRLYLFESILQGRDKQVIPIQVSASTLSNQGEKAGLVCFIKDLRALRRLEQEMADQARILHQDKMISLGRLSASVVHEINNPLSGILNYLRLMQRIIKRDDLTPEGKLKFQRYLALVESETDRCSQIVSNLLIFSRKSPPSRGNVQIEDLLNRCIMLSRHKIELSKIDLIADISTHLPVIQGDFSQLQQCIINLIFNAVDAMCEGGKLTLSARLDPTLHHVIIAISDTGAGIAEADLPHIFEPFYSTKKEGYGVGLGLSTVYGILQHHCGKIDATSQAGKGTVFTLRLPY